MVEPFTALALMMQKKPGAYALLLGSGVSRVAQIPTGWDIVLDLIRRVAAIEQHDCGEHPDQWFRDIYSEEPNYSVLLEQLAQLPAERNQIIREYIEPNDEERDIGLKLPTDAHHAIAELVSGGYVRVILTTNFDRLVEVALAEVGIVPEVIASPDAVNGVLPLAHNTCTVIKLHGDYHDARTLNTAAELNEYHPDLQRILDQALREYGLVVCGWSADWDPALAAAIQKSRCEFFSTFWISPRGPREKAQELIDQRQARVVTGMDSDALFRRLSDTVTSLNELTSPELVSVAVARAAVRRYIDDPNRRVRLHELVVGEAGRIRKEIDEQPLDYYLVDSTKDVLVDRLETYEQRTEVLRTVLATGCFWGAEQHEDHWIGCFERLSSLPALSQSREDVSSLRYYPAFLALYTAGIAATAKGNFSTLNTILNHATGLHRESHERFPLVVTVDGWLLTQHAANVLSPGTVSDAVLPLRFSNHPELWSPLRDYIPEDDRFNEHFCLFEYLYGLSAIDWRLMAGMRPRAPKGWLAFRDNGMYARNLVQRVSQALGVDGSSWPPIQGGMFGGSLDRLQKARAVYDPVVMSVW